MHRAAEYERINDHYCLQDGLLCPEVFALESVLDLNGRKEFVVGVDEIFHQVELLGLKHHGCFVLRTHVKQEIKPEIIVVDLKLVRNFKHEEIGFSVGFRVCQGENSLVGLSKGNHQHLPRIEKVDVEWRRQA